MNKQELKLHISTPQGIVYDDFIDNCQIKVHDGYMAINKNELPFIETVQISLLKIKTLDKKERTYLIGRGVLKVEKLVCSIYTQYLIDRNEIEKGQFINSMKEFKKQLSNEEKQSRFYVKQESRLLKELDNIKNQK